MSAAKASARNAGPLIRWWRRRRSARRAIEHAVWDLSERYGDAAFGIACSSARQPAGAMRRDFWHQVAARLSRA